MKFFFKTFRLTIKYKELKYRIIYLEIYCLIHYGAVDLKIPKKTEQVQILDKPEPNPFKNLRSNPKKPEKNRFLKRIF